MLGKNAEECLGILRKMECTLCQEYLKANPGPCYLNCEGGGDCNVDIVNKEINRLRQAMTEAKAYLVAYQPNDTKSMNKAWCILDKALTGGV